MEKIAYIQEFETPMLFQYPASRLAIGIGFPMLLYLLFVLPIGKARVLSTQEAWILTSSHISLFIALFWMINLRFPKKLIFQSGLIEMIPFLGSPHKLPYEELEAILETNYVTLFAQRSGRKWLFIPRQTYRTHDFKLVLTILQEHLQKKHRHALD